MKLKWLKDKLGEKFYPIAHATGVVVAENKTLDSKLDEIDKSLTKINEDIKDNGYGEVAGGKNLANFSKLGMKTSNGITFEYQSNGSIKVSGTVLNKDDNVYTPLNLTKTRLSKGHWYTASVKSSNPKSIAKLFFTDKGAATTLQVPETADMYYYIQFFDGVEGKIPAGTVINEVLYPQLEEGKVVTEYEPSAGGGLKKIGCDLLICHQILVNYASAVLILPLTIALIAKMRHEMPLKA